MNQKHAVLLSAAWLMVMVCVAGSVLTLISTDMQGGRMLFASEKREIAQRYARLEEVRRILQEGYYQDVDDDILMEGAVRGMLAAINDPYTFYYSPDEMAAHAQETGESYHGIGMLVQSNPEGFIEVIRVYANGPAENAGLEVGDLIVGINQQPVNGRDEKSLNEALREMRSSEEGEVLLTILRNDMALDFRLIPAEVSVNNVTGNMLNNDIAYINIFQFGADAGRGFQMTLERLIEAGAEKLVIDLRNNPGGLLESVVDIADQLLDEKLIVYIEDREGGRQNYDSDAQHCEIPLAVLVNGMSASASEILACAVQDHGRGVVVGTQTFGKGIVQTLVTFENDGSGMQYTSASYYTPNGKSIHGEGMQPDIVVEAENTTSLSGMPDIENDVQLRAAVSWLNDA